MRNTAFHRLKGQTTDKRRKIWRPNDEMMSGMDERIES